jgi:hypothetical protein
VEHGDGGPGKAEPPREERRDRGVRPAALRRGAHAYPEAVAVRAEELVARGARNDLEAHPHDGPVAFRGPRLDGRGPAGRARRAYFQPPSGSGTWA